MKRILYLDASAGVSGDMFVGALIDAGADIEKIRSHIDSLGLEGFSIRARKMSKSGLMGTKFDVIDNETGRDVDATDENRHGHGVGQDHTHHHDHGHHHHHGHSHGHHHHGHEQDHGHSHDHDHAHGHGSQNPHHHRHSHGDGQDHTHHHDHSHHDHGHEDGHGHSHSHGDGDSRRNHGHHHRGLGEISEIIGRSGLPLEVIDDAIAVFRLIATAESKVHGSTQEEVHFHEVGAIDCIVDIVSAASAFHQLKIDEAWCSPIHVGSGTVRCAHGVLPVPAPATMELLRDVPIYSTEIKGELATPTGAALVRHFCKGFAPMPRMTVDSVGYGAGSKDFGIPNLLRATLGKVDETIVPPQ